MGGKIGFNLRLLIIELALAFRKNQGILPLNPFSFFQTIVHLVLNAARLEIGCKAGDADEQSADQHNRRAGKRCHGGLGHHAHNKPAANNEHRQRNDDGQNQPDDTLTLGALPFLAEIGIARKRFVGHATG